MVSIILVHSDDYDMPSLAIPTTMICHIKSCQNLTNLKTLHLYHARNAISELKDTNAETTD